LATPLTRATSLNGDESAAVLRAPTSALPPAAPRSRPCCR